MTPVFRVGLTGGIASGKSTVANLFAALGVPVIDSDVIARDVVAPGSALLERIRAEFGGGVLAPDGSLDRCVHGSSARPPIRPRHGAGSRR